MEVLAIDPDLTPGVDAVGPIYFLARASSDALGVDALGSPARRNPGSIMRGEVAEQIGGQIFERVLISPTLAESPSGPRLGDSFAPSQE